MGPRMGQMGSAMGQKILCGRSLPTLYFLHRILESASFCFAISDHPVLLKDQSDVVIIGTPEPAGNLPDCSPAGFSNSFRLLRWDRILSYISNLCIPGVLSLSLLPDSLRTVLAVKGSLRHTKQRRALDGSGPFLTTFLR